MRKPLEMYVTSRMHNIVQIRARNGCFAARLFLKHSLLLGFSRLLKARSSVGAELALNPIEKKDSRKRFVDIDVF